MHERTKRILIAVALGLVVAAVNNRLDAEFARLAVSTAATPLNDLIVGSVAALCAYGWTSLSAERNAREALAEKLKQEGVLQERTRLAHEIHDTLAQGFAGMIISLEAATQFLESSPDARIFCERALRIGRESLAEARSLLRGLRPPALERQDLRRALARLTETLTEGAGLRTECLIEEMPAQLSPNTEAELFRIVQEAITNTVQHAHATRLRVTLRAPGNQLQLCVEDDGCGFLSRHAAADKRYGLTVMRERAKDLGGILWLYTQPGRGTQVIACIPVSNEPGSKSCSPRAPVSLSSPAAMPSTKA
jgi:signal transduction histidine kinase